MLDTTATAHRLNGSVHPGIPVEQPWAEKMLHLFLTFYGAWILGWGEGRGLLLGGCLFSLSPHSHGDLYFVQH